MFSFRKAKSCLYSKYYGKRDSRRGWSKPIVRCLYGAIALLWSRYLSLIRPWEASVSKKICTSSAGHCFSRQRMSGKKCAAQLCKVFHGFLCDANIPLSVSSYPHWFTCMVRRIVPSPQLQARLLEPASPKSLNPFAVKFTVTTTTTVTTRQATAQLLMSRRAILP